MRSCIHGNSAVKQPPKSAPHPARSGGTYRKIRYLLQNHSEQFTPDHRKRKRNRPHFTDLEPFLNKQVRAGDSLRDNHQAICDAAHGPERVPTRLFQASQPLQKAAIEAATLSPKSSETAVVG
jgi:hypothetical protein